MPITDAVDGNADAAPSVATTTGPGNVPSSSSSSSVSTSTMPASGGSQRRPGTGALARRESNLTLDPATTADNDDDDNDNDGDGHRRRRRRQRRTVDADGDRDEGPDDRESADRRGGGGGGGGGAGVGVVPTAEPWMSRALFHTLWANAPLAVRSSCTFTRYHRRLANSDSFIGTSSGSGGGGVNSSRGWRARVTPQPPTGTTTTTLTTETRVDGDGDGIVDLEETMRAVALAMAEDEHLDFQDQLVQSLGGDLVVFPPMDGDTDAADHARRSLAASEIDPSERELVLYAYATVRYGPDGTQTILLVRIEQLYGSEQLAVSVKNTDPIDEARMMAFMGILQQRLQPGAPPRRPLARVRDTTSAFLDDEDDRRGLGSTRGGAPAIAEEGEEEQAVEHQARPQHRPAKIQTTDVRRDRGDRPSRLPPRGRSHTVRYRTDRGIAFEGYLNKKSEVIAAWKPIYCVLEGDTLAYYASREDFVSNSRLLGRIKVLAVGDDPEHAEDPRNGGKANQCFQVMTEGRRIHHLSSRTAFEREQWKRALMTASQSNTAAQVPQVAFASQALDPAKFYQLLGALLRHEIGDVPLLFRCIHPDVILTSNLPPIVPFWGQYRRYDGVLLFISTLLESVAVESFDLREVLELVDGDADCVDGLGDEEGIPLTPSPGSALLKPTVITTSNAEESPRSATEPLSNVSDMSSTTPSTTWARRFVVTGKETWNLLDVDNRRVTQLFVHELWLDPKGRLVRWHLNGDAVALSVAFDGAAKGENIRLVLPGEASSIGQSIPGGMFYVQIMRAQQLTPADAGSGDHGGSSGHSGKKTYPVYVRCILQEGTHMDRTMDGLEMSDAQVEESSKTKLKASTNHRRPSASTRLFRGLKRAAGISGERTFAAYGDSSGCVTSTCKSGLDTDGVTLRPEWRTNLRLEFPGCSRGYSYFLRLEVFQSRFMLPDALLGVCKINLTQHLALFNGSAEAKANGALPRWHNLCDQYNDCRESWAPPTVFRGRIQVAVIFAPTFSSVEALNDPKLHGQHRRQSASPVSLSRRASVEETFTQGKSNEAIRELLKQDNALGDYGGVRGLLVTSTPSPRNRYDQTNSQDPRSESLIDDEGAKRLHELRRDNHVFAGKKTVFDVPKKYQMIKVVGSGTYGEVIAASDTDTGNTVAIKKVSNAFAELADTRRIIRELCLLQQLRHPNLIRLYDLPRPERLAYLEDIYLVTDLMETDLHRVIHSSQTLTDEHVAYFMRQILRALQYLHSANILHRDLKPSNILVTSTCDIKVCDLGLARYVDYKQATHHPGSNGKDDIYVELTEYVVTRWYRAPEILLDGIRYDKPSDLWSAGCILAELLGRKPLFPGTSTTNQLQKIFGVLGTPDIVYTANISKEPAQKWVHRQRRRAPIPFHELYPNANYLALDLLSKLLVYEPRKRITAAEALRHPYLKEAFRSIVSADDSDDFTSYNAAEEDEDHFDGVIDDTHELVPESKEAMQRAVFDQICTFHPEALEYETLLKEHDEQFEVDPITGKLVRIAKNGTR